MPVNQYDLKLMKKRRLLKVAHGCKYGVRARALACL